MASEIPHKLHKTITGKHIVKYGCPSCGLVLENAFIEAGKRDSCPGCKASFEVPGESTKREQTERLVAAEEEKRQESLRRVISDVEAKNRQIELEKQKRIEEEKARQELLKNHSGYLYHVANFNSTIDNCDKVLAKMLNDFAEVGWEYVGFEVVKLYAPPGCLAGILGFPGRFEVYHLVTFEKPLRRSESLETERA